MSCANEMAANGMSAEIISSFFMSTSASRTKLIELVRVRPDVIHKRNQLLLIPALDQGPQPSRTICCKRWSVPGLFTTVATGGNGSTLTCRNQLTADPSN